MNKTDVTRLLAVAAYHLWTNTIRDNPDAYSEMVHPKIGDLIMEISSLKRIIDLPDKNNYARRIGFVVAMDEDNLIIDDLSGRRTEWHKVGGGTQFIVLPTELVS